MSDKINLTPWCDVEQWGNPWHGRLVGADFYPDPPTAEPIPGAVPAVGGQAQLVWLTGLPMPTTTDAETAAGMSWRPWAILAGNRRQYTPFGEIYLNAQTWIYQAPDGAVFRLRVRCSAAAGPATITAERLEPDGGSIETIYTGFAGYQSWLYQDEIADRTTVSASATGNVAVVNINAPAEFRLQTAGASTLDSPSGIIAATPAVAFRVDVAGGGFGGYPTVTVSAIAGDNVFAQTPHAATTAGSTDETVKWFVGAWCSPSGDVIPWHFSVRAQRTFMAGWYNSGLGWFAYCLTSFVFNAKVHRGSSEYTILQVTGGAEYEPVDYPGNTDYFPSYRKSDTPTVYTWAGAESDTSDTWPSSSLVFVQPSQDRAVWRSTYTTAAGSREIVLGALGGVEVTSPWDMVNLPWCQHPLTGALARNSHFF